MSDNKLLTFYGEFSLKYWIDLILRQEIVLPTFQRKFVWNPLMIRKLIETLSKGHYVPSVLISNCRENDCAKRTNLVLDGQQRLTTLLLCYFEIFPLINKDEYKTSAKEWNSDWICNWDWGKFVDTFNNLGLLGYYQNALYDIIRKKLIDSGNYISIDDKRVEKFISKHDKDINDFINNIKNKEFFENRLLGYSYIKYEKPDEEKEIESFAHIFRVINTSGKDLTPMQSRKPLYGIRKISNTNKYFSEYFEPAFTKTMYLQKDPIDFVPLLAYTAEYFNNEKKNLNEPECVAYGYGYVSKREIYYEEYVLSCIQDRNDDDFGQFSKNVHNPIEKISKVEHNFKKIYEKYVILKKSKSKDSQIVFDNIIELQYLMFGLIYWVVYQEREFDTKLDELSNKLFQAFSADIKKLEFRQYNQIEQVRYRLKESIKIYGEVLNAN